ncbi:MAG: trehalase family glycosidase [Bacteroidota bacterium]|nr:trehalase family glycosidase [Bacteroidota bacterium]
MIRRDFLGYSAVGIGGMILLPNCFAENKEETPLSAAEVVELPKNVSYLWYDSDGNGRNLYCNFRKKIFVKGKIKTALFNLFADTSYQLFVNEQFVCQGPVRFDPRFPLYDPIDLKPYLKEDAENVIAIQVNYFGIKTYKSMKSNAGMVCWGTIESAGGKIELASNPKNWKAAKANERSRYTPKMSFALNPNDFYDQSKAEKWKQISFNDAQWKPAIEITKQNAWGSLKERSIPFLDNSVIAFDNTTPLIKIVPIINKEDKYSFTIEIPDQYEDNKPLNKKYYIPYYTYIFSDEEKVVRDISVFWGEMWLNGKQILPYENDFSDLKLSIEFTLKKGWNYLFGKVGPYTDILDFYIGIPKGANLVLSADKNGESGVIFRHGTYVSVSDFEKYFLNKELPYAEQSNLPGDFKWVEAKKENKAENAAFESSWDTYGTPFEAIPISNLSGKTFNISDYPSGFGLLFDLEYIRLSYPYLKASGAKGTTIDLVYCEYIAKDQLHLTPTFNYQSADRVKCAENVIEYMPNQPRGIRYMMITFRNISENIKIEDFKIIKATYPAVKKGKFISSDPLMNSIWEMCALTQEANMEDAYVDCVGRERGMYTRDTIIQYFNNLALFGDHKLFRRCMELYGQSPDDTRKIRAVYPNTGNYTISDFALNALEGFWAYYENTGDKSLIEQYWNPIVKNLEWFQELSDERADRLLDAEWNVRKGVRANYGGFHGDLNVVNGYRSITGMNCEFSCTYLIALRCAKKLADAIGKKEDSKNYAFRIDTLSKSIHDLLWDESEGCYADNFEKKTHSSHASLFAIRAGVVDEKQLEKIKPKVAYQLRSLFVNGYDDKNGVYMSPSYAFYIFDGLYKAGLYDTAENLIRQGWGFFLTKGNRTTPEYFDDTNMQSRCHAWSASPVYYLSKYILGIHFPNLPDANTVEIKPLTNTIQHAEGVYPHPKGGLIEVKWHTENGKKVFDYVKAPNGVKVSY